MGAQELLTRSVSRVGERRRPVEPDDPENPLPRAVFLGVAASASVLLVVASREIFLFWDDFVFLGEAKDAELDRDYLALPLFTHFSPVTRLINWMVAPAVAEHPWVVLAVQALLLVTVVSAVTWLMIVLHGRTRTALGGAVVLAPSLTLVPLGNWWTAGINILPALAGFLVAFGAMVLVLRGRSRWWAVPCLLGAAIGVLDYELPILLPAYLGLWVLLFRSRVTAESLPALVRRTWWLWLGLLAISGVAAANYRLNYYAEVPSPGAGDAAQALVRSLAGTLVPTLVGFHNPRSDTFSILSLVIGCVVLAALVGWLLLTRPDAWRGLLFAAAGWVLPSLALILNRVEIYGVVVVDNAIYFFLPSVLFLVGVLEAVRAPRRAARRSVPDARIRRVLGVVVGVVVATAYAVSVGPSATYQLPPGASGDYVEKARAATERLAGAQGGGPVNVLDSEVPGSVVPSEFAPANRVSSVLGLTVPGLVFDDPEPPYHLVDGSGDVRLAEIEWVARTPEIVDRTGELKLHDVDDLVIADGRACFTTAEKTSVLWTLPAAVGGRLVVRTSATAAEPTPFNVSVQPDGAEKFEAANPVGQQLDPDLDTVLDAVAAGSIRALRLRGLDPGVEMCLTRIEIGTVTG